VLCWPLCARFKVTYHYHASAVTNLAGAPHQPYYLGCQGPSVGQCNGTVRGRRGSSIPDPALDVSNMPFFLLLFYVTQVTPDYDGGANWCGPGCGFEVCIATSRSRSSLYTNVFIFIEQYSSHLVEISKIPPNVTVAAAHPPRCACSQAPTQPRSSATSRRFPTALPGSNASP
jgi:hypothetical protein